MCEICWLLFICDLRARLICNLRARLICNLRARLIGDQRTWGEVRHDQAKLLPGPWLNMVWVRTAATAARKTTLTRTEQIACIYDTRRDHSDGMHLAGSLDRCFDHSFRTVTLNTLHQEEFPSTVVANIINSAGLRQVWCCMLVQACSIVDDSFATHHRHSACRFHDTARRIAGALAMAASEADSLTHDSKVLEAEAQVDHWAPRLILWGTSVRELKYPVEADAPSLLQEFDRQSIKWLHCMVVMLIVVGDEYQHVHDLAGVVITGWTSVKGNEGMNGDEILHPVGRADLLVECRIILLEVHVHDDGVSSDGLRQRVKRTLLPLGNK